MISLLLYFIYIAGLVGVVFIFNWVHLKLETMRLKHRFIEKLIDSGYETDKIDLNEFIK